MITRDDQHMMKRLRAVIEEMDGSIDYAMVQWCLGELEELEQYLLAKELAK